MKGLKVPKGIVRQEEDDGAVLLACLISRCPLGTQWC